MHARTHLTLHPIPDHLAADTAVAMHSTGTTALDVLRQARLYGTDAVLVMTAAEAHAALESRATEGMVVLTTDRFNA